MLSLQPEDEFYVPDPSPEQLFERQKTHPVYLTCAGDDVCHGTSTLMRLTGLPFFESPDGCGDYPLTDAERQFISPHRVGIGRAELDFNCSQMFEGRKWACPQLTYVYGHDASHTRDEITLRARVVYPRLAKRVEAGGGRAVAYYDALGVPRRVGLHELSLLWPFDDLITRFAAFQPYRDWLVDLVEKARP